MNYILDSELDCNGESQLTEYETYLLLKLIVSNLAVTDLERPIVEEYLNQIVLNSPLKLKGSGTVGEKVMALIKERYGASGVKTFRVGNIKYALELQKKDIGEFTDFFQCESSRFTVIKHYYISTFLSHSMSIRHLLELRKLIEKFSLSLKSCAALATQVEGLGFEPAKGQFASHKKHLNTKAMINKMNKDEKEYFFIMLSDMARCDQIIIKEELVFLKKVLVELDIDTSEKFIPEVNEARKTLHRYSNENHLNVLRNFFHIAEIDGVMMSVEKLFLIHMAL